MNQIQTSVAMCTYNGARYLREQLQSIASQTLLPDELVICDDGSSDDSVAILREFAAQAAFLVKIYVNENNLGPARNFEKAIDLCRGEIIALCDQDDIWNPQKISFLLEVFERNRKAMYAFSDAELINDEAVPEVGTLWDAVGFRNRLGRFSGAGQLEILLRHNLIPGAAMAFRASCKRILFPLPDAWMHDYWIVLLGSALSYGVPVNEPLFKYRRHAMQVCGWRKQTYLQVLRTSLKTDPQEAWKKLENFQKLTGRVASMSESSPCPPECARLLKDKESHLLRRATIRSSTGISRIASIFSEARTGRYSRYSDSWQSIFRDL
jgi:glycosyltransferase involved in cell wall biosynthesis